MNPTKDDHAVVDLLGVLLEEGVVVQADVLITVADVPLVGVNLRAAIAGMTTMREYGFFAEWDEAVRERAIDDEGERTRSEADPEDEWADDDEDEQSRQRLYSSSGGTNGPTDTV